MKILQWNIWYKEDPENILTELRRIDTDVCCLQEVTVNHPRHGIDVGQLLAKELGYHIYYHESMADDQSSFGNAILSRFPILESRHVFVQDPPPADTEENYSKEGRVYVEVKIDSGNRPVTVGTTHLSYTDRFIETDAKKFESGKLSELVKGIKGEYVLTGDFNVVPDSYTVTELQKHLTHAGPDFSQKTWTTKPFSYNGFDATTLDWRLDYCFTSQEVSVVSASVVETLFSDHLPILLEI